MIGELRYQLSQLLRHFKYQIVFFGGGIFYMLVGFLMPAKDPTAFWFFTACGAGLIAAGAADLRKKFRKAAELRAQQRAEVAAIVPSTTTGHAYGVVEKKKL